MSFALNHQLVGLRWQHMTHPSNSCVKSIQRKSRSEVPENKSESDGVLSDTEENIFSLVLI